MVWLFWYFTIVLTRLFSLLEHFPKPGTKADTRMLMEEEKRIEETSSEGSDEGEDEEEGKSAATPQNQARDKNRAIRSN